MVGLDPTIHAGTRGQAAAEKNRLCQYVGRLAWDGVDPRVEPEDDVVPICF
jgi:hypothetical protein